MPMSSDSGGRVSRDPAAKTARFIYISDADKGSAWHTPKAHNQLRVGWRLIAANNRSLGRSWVVYGSFDACVAAVAQLHDRLDEITPAVTFDARHAAWTWTVLLDGEPVAVSTRAYRRRVECIRSFDQFLGAVTTAPEVAEELRYYGPKALSVYDHPPLHPDILSLPSPAAPDPAAADNAEPVTT
jgi:hypothetical protein